MKVEALDVVVVFDQTIEPPGPKMVAAIVPAAGLYYRINTKPWRPAIRLLRSPDHPWLDHDSFLECGDLLEIDDFLIEEALRRKGVIGRLNVSIVPELRRRILDARYLPLCDKQMICAVLSGYVTPD